jgi:hypothetical protein
MGEYAKGDELFEGSLDPVAADVAVKEAPDLIPGQAVFGLLDGKLDAVGGEVTGGGAEVLRGAASYAHSQVPDHASTLLRFPMTVESD